MNLEKFSARLSDDPLKRDLELTCDDCGRVLCDVQAGDSLAVLASIAVGHTLVCTGPRVERLKRESGRR